MGAGSSGQAGEAWEPLGDLGRVDGDMGSCISSFYGFALGLVSWSSTPSNISFPYISYGISTFLKSVVEQDRTHIKCIHSFH